jgi:hypothetical protein
MKDETKVLEQKQQEELIRVLKDRFEKNSNRHKSIEWVNIESKLKGNVEKLWTLNEMERTGGEPDVVGFDKETGEYIIYDCSPESPTGRRNICYDRDAQVTRKIENLPHIYANVVKHNRYIPKLAKHKQYVAVLAKQIR